MKLQKCFIDYKTSPDFTWLNFSFFVRVHLSFKVTNFDEKKGLPVLILEIFLFQRHESKFSVPVWLVPSHTNHKTIKKRLWRIDSIKQQRNLKSTVKSCSPSEKQTSSLLWVFKTFQYWLLLEDLISLHRIFKFCVQHTHETRQCEVTKIITLVCFLSAM